MEDLLNKEILSNSIQTYLVVIGTILMALIIKRFITKYLASVLYKMVNRAGKSFHKKLFLELIVSPLENFIVLLIALIALDKLTFPPLLDFPLHKISSRDAIEAIVNATLVILFIRLCIRIIKFIALILEEKANATADQSDNQLIIFFNDFIKVILVIIGGLLILKFSFHYQISNLLTGLSLVGAAVALATKESLENLIASFIIFFDKPFIVGDTVKVQSFTGIIEKIGLRSTRIRTDHKTYITDPNKQMVDTILDNVSMRTQRKVELRLEIDLSASADQLKKIITGIRLILQKSAIESISVYLGDTGKNAHLIVVDYFTTINQDLTEFNELKQEVNLEVIELLRIHDIQLAANDTKISISKQKEN